MFAVETLLTQSCTVDHRDPGPEDPYGDHPLEAVTSTDYPCWFGQSTRTEEIVGTSAIERERWNLYLPPDAVIDANDTVWLDGAPYEVNGNPWQVRDPVTAAASHIEATLERRR